MHMAGRQPTRLNPNIRTILDQSRRCTQNSRSRSRSRSSSSIITSFLQIRAELHPPDSMTNMHHHTKEEQDHLDLASHYRSRNGPVVLCVWPRLQRQRQHRHRPRHRFRHRHRHQQHRVLNLVKSRSTGPNPTAKFTATIASTKMVGANSQGKQPMPTNNRSKAAGRPAQAIWGTRTRTCPTTTLTGWTTAQTSTS